MIALPSLQDSDEATRPRLSPAALRAPVKSVRAGVGTISSGRLLGMTLIEYDQVSNVPDELVLAPP